MKNAVLKKAAIFLAAIALLAIFIGAEKSAENGAETVEQAFQNLSKIDKKASEAYQKTFDEAKAKDAAASPEKATGLIKEYRGVTAAYQEMFIAAFRAGPDDETAFVLMRALSKFDLPDDVIEILCSYLGKSKAAMEISPAVKQPESKEMAEAVNWLKKQRLYPAYDALLQQGKKIIPILEKKVKDFDGKNPGFNNAIKILVSFEGKEHVLLWVDKSDLSSQQKTIARQIVADSK